MNNPGRRRESGNVMIEFALSSVVAVPLMLGIVFGGITLGRGIQASQIARDTAHMFAKGVDFAKLNCVEGDITSCNQHLIVRLAEGTGLTLNGGNGVVILSQVTKVFAEDCEAANLSDADCRNKGQAVFLFRTTVGNEGLRSSNFGTPAANLIQDDNTVKDYLKDQGAQASGILDLIDLGRGDVAYVVECYLQTSDLFGGGRGIYAYSIF